METEFVVLTWVKTAHLVLQIVQHAVIFPCILYFVFFTDIVLLKKQHHALGHHHAMPTAHVSLPACVSVTVLTLGLTAVNVWGKKEENMNSTFFFLHTESIGTTVDLPDNSTAGVVITPNEPDRTIFTILIREIREVDTTNAIVYSENIAATNFTLQVF